MNEEAPPFISVRFCLAILAFFLFFIFFAQNISMSVAIICMINNTALDTNNERNSTNYIINQTSLDCDQIDSVNHAKTDGPFPWPKDIQGLALSSYFFGYLLTQIPGGWLALRYGTKYVLSIMLFLGSIFTLLLPLAANFHYIALIAVRFLIGASLGGIWPSTNGFWAAWAPPNERSTLIGIASAGGQIGNVVALQFGGVLCSNGDWPMIFYIFGGLGLAWLIIWFIYASDTPNTNKFIGKAEREYIEKETKQTMANYKNAAKTAPWSQIITSKTCISLFIGHSCQNFGTYMFLTQLPTYMKEILKFDIKSNGTLSAVPYVFFWLVIILSGIIGDRLVNKAGLSKTTVRKIFNSLGFFIPMFSVIALTFISCKTKYLGVFFLTLGLAFTGCTYGAGFYINYNDVSGSYTGIVFGIGNCFGTIPGIIAPYLVSSLTSNKTQSEWSIVFYIAAAIYLMGVTVLLFFSSSDIEPWAIQKTIKEEEKAGEKIRLQESTQL